MRSLLDWLRGKPIEDEAEHSRRELEALKAALLTKEQRAERLRREILKVEKLPR